jgi:hypothetical protein
MLGRSLSSLVTRFPSRSPKGPNTPRYCPLAQQCSNGMSTVRGRITSPTGGPCDRCPMPVDSFEQGLVMAAPAPSHYPMAIADGPQMARGGAIGWIRATKGGEGEGRTHRVSDGSVPGARTDPRPPPCPPPPEAPSNRCPPTTGLCRSRWPRRCSRWAPWPRPPIFRQGPHISMPRMG